MIILINIKEIITICCKLNEFNDSKNDFFKMGKKEEGNIMQHKICKKSVFLIIFDYLLLFMLHLCSINVN